MPLPDATRRSPMMHRIVAAAWHRRRLILFLALFSIFTAAASFMLSIATLLQILLNLLLVLFLNLITFRGDIAQDLVLKLTRYLSGSIRRPPAPIPQTSDV